MFALQPPSGFVHLVLLSHEESPFYLEIPMDIMARLCLKPRKYLRYLGWCVLGTIGVLTDDKGEELELSGGILNQAIYHYVVPVQDALACAVDLEVIRQPPPDEDEPFATPKADRDYGAKLQARDGRCVWTSITHAVGVPIIPHETGDEWLQLIIASRPNDEGLDPALRTVDFQNGFYASADILINWFAPRTVAVLKTPNPILDTTDVPARHVRRIAEGLSYPTDARYTLQWLVPEDPFALPQIPNNNDATFLDQQMPRPSDLLLHYNYGAAAVKNWGRNMDVLGQRPGLPRPHVLPPRRRPVEEVDSGEEIDWDEDDMMMLLWSYSHSAARAQEQKEHMDYMEKWVAGVSGPPDDLFTEATGVDYLSSGDDDSDPFDGGHYP